MIQVTDVSLRDYYIPQLRQYLSVVDLAWEWTEPNSFWSAVGFLIVWGILTKIGHFIVSLIVMGIASIFD